MATTQTPTPTPPEPEAVLPGEQTSSSWRSKLNDLGSGRLRNSAKEGGSLVDEGYPTINLVSPKLVEEQAARRLTRRFGFGLILIVVLIAFGWWIATLQISGLNATQTEAQKNLQQATVALGGLKSVTDIGANVTANQSQISKQLQSEALTSKVVRQFLASIPRGVSIDGYSMQMLSLQDIMSKPGTGGVDPTNPCASAPDPFNKQLMIGCLHFSGSAATYDLASRLVNYIHGSYLTDAYVGGISGGKTGWSFSGTVGVLPAALSGRYQDGAALRNALMKGVLPTPAPQPSAGSK